jgi:V/A-type H+-transporting ATPase subunit F
VKFYCIGDEETVRGFSLAGIAGQVAINPQQAARALQLAVGRRDYGIILLSDSLAAGIRDQVENIRLEREQPLIVEVPGPQGWMADRKELRQLVQQAVGLSMS